MSTPIGDDGLFPCGEAEAVQRMLELESLRIGQYVWGTGGYDPRHPELHGMTENKGLAGWDCAGACSYALRLCRHIPGFNRQPHATIEDDWNVDSCIEDADPDRGGLMQLGELVTIPAPGILLLTPTIRAPDPYPEPGHVRMIIDATRWNPKAPKWADVTYLECHGPNGHKPGVTRATGEHVDVHDRLRPAHRAVIVRVRARP